MRTIQNVFNHFPNTRGIDIVRVYISHRFGNVTVREFDFDCRKSWWENFRNANFSVAFLDEYSEIFDFEFVIESNSIVLEIQVTEVKNDD